MRRPRLPARAAASRATGRATSAASETRRLVGPVGAAVAARVGRRAVDEAEARPGGPEDPEERWAACREVRRAVRGAARAGRRGS